MSNAYAIEPNSNFFHHSCDSLPGGDALPLIPHEKPKIEQNHAMRGEVPYTLLSPMWQAFEQGRLVRSWIHPSHASSDILASTTLLPDITRNDMVTVIIVDYSRLLQPLYNLQRMHHNAQVPQTKPHHILALTLCLVTMAAAASPASH